MGEIVRIDGYMLYVRMVVNSACSKCHARSVCGVDESKDKIVEVFSSNASEYSVGESVEVALREKSMGAMSVMLAYVVPFIVLTLLLVGVSVVGGSESQAALTSLIGVALYYLVLWRMRAKIKRKIEFIITKQIK